MELLLSGFSSRHSSISVSVSQGISHVVPEAWKATEESVEEEEGKKIVEKVCFCFLFFSFVFWLF